MYKRQSFAWAKAISANRLASSNSILARGYRECKAFSTGEKRIASPNPPVVTAKIRLTSPGRPDKSQKVIIVTRKRLSNSNKVVKSQNWDGTVESSKYNLSVANSRLSKMLLAKLNFARLPNIYLWERYQLSFQNPTNSFQNHR